MVDNKLDHDIVKKEPLMVIKNGMRVDTYKLGQSIKEALKDLEFDIIINSISVLPRKVVIEEDTEEE